MNQDSHPKFNFGAAIELAKEGKLVTREGWNGKNMFIFIRPADELDVDMIVNKVKSLPQSVKDYFNRDTYYIDDNGTDKEVDKKEILVKFTAYLCMKAVDGTIVNGWLASQTDMLAEDWQVFIV